MGYAVKQFLLRHIILVAAWITLMTVYVSFGTNLSDYSQKDSITVERVTETVYNIDDVSRENSTTYAVAMLLASICMLIIWFLLFDMVLDETFILSIADLTWIGVALCITCLGGGIAAFIVFLNMII